MATIISIIAFLVIFFLIVKVGLSLTSENKMSKKRLAEFSEAEENFIQLQTEFNQEKSSLATMLEGIVGTFQNIEDDREELGYKLYRAGATSPNAMAYYLFFNSFGWVIGLIVFGLFYYAAKTNPGLFLPILLVGLLNFVFITFGAKLWLKNTTEKRQKILVRSFPDMLDLLLVCVESGLALDAALARICKELKYAHPEMTKELNRTRIELTMLNDRERALSNFAKRTDLLPVKSLVAALLQSEKFGTSLIDTLRVLSDDYRHTRMMAAEEKAGKLPTKIAVTTLPFMLIALLILIASPAVIKASQALDTKAKNEAKGE